MFIYLQRSFVKFNFVEYLVVTLRYIFKREAYGWNPLFKDTTCDQENPINE